MLMAYPKDIDQDEIDEVIDRHLKEINDGPLFRGTNAAAVLAKIQEDPRFTGMKHSDLPLYKRLRANIIFRIAAIMLFALFTILYVVRSGQQESSTNIARLQTPIVPGSNKAVLTLANGKKISLNDVAVGELANEGSVSIRKAKNGQVIYDLSKPVGRRLPTGYNTIETPKGGAYHVILPDGTLVWLNSASSLTFPAKFSDAGREVTLKGEAYFEVARHKTIPFHVNVKGSRVEVHGTHFNISAYEDDVEVATTLLEGSVSVSKNSRKSLLVPGQQSLISDGSDDIEVKIVNVEDVMAWHNGYFKFNDEKIESILKQVSRWYDVEVVYRNTRPSQKLGGMSYRTKPLPDLLDQLEKIGNLHFKLEGRRIIVVD